MTDENDKFKHIIDSTAALVRKGETKKVLKLIKDQLNEDDPQTMIMLTTLATIMKNQGKMSEAYDIYSSLYDKLKDSNKLGPDHKDVLSLFYNMSLTTSSNREKNKILSYLIEVAKKNKYNDLLETYYGDMKKFKESLPENQRRLYNLVEKEQGISTVAPKKRVTQTVMPENEIDKLVIEFELQCYDNEDAIKKKKRNNKKD